MKTYQIFSVLFFLLFLPENLFSQDILFKKDKTPLKVIIKDFDGKTIVYELPGDSTKTIYHISTSTLDSLRYCDGNSVYFGGSPDLNNQQLKMISRNFLEVELVDLITGKVKIDFERSSNTGRTSFVTGLFVNTRRGEFDYWPDYHYILQYTTYRPYSFFAQIGINFYPFEYSLSMTRKSRLSTGFSFLLGSLRKMDYTIYDPYDGFQIKTVTGASLLWNLRERIYLNNHLQVIGGVETSILPILTFICPQVTLSAGF